ncbi:hypothetical protein GCM10008107_14950 [Psychrosphaera saromensis]|uniref:Uncharacterized protein n=1 Tax=Psychrosphaera saromensis TaxID=716813 RepID=A0A2S7UUU4_9GAMM|nr:hypothetical protein [Psychrosphaera saromensis]PQJ53282.1 hypothetical protein BTO11_06100 [Psychrosphaera saromensis]GHB66685.1 hypothetical protein GCM10008107_14950 [Psychrosphaera saromensis]GLQ14951.1 hypothetical protein GCM10007917_24060 [Psychrosphaera saromensis]
MKIKAIKLISIFVFISLSGYVSASTSDSFSVFDTAINLDESCNIHITNKSGKSSVQSPFHTSVNAVKKCRIVTHPHTSIVNTKFINGGYIVFVENNHTELETCFSEYTAFQIMKTGEVNMAGLIKRSGSCFQSKEGQDFEYFSAKINKK